MLGNTPFHGTDKVVWREHVLQPLSKRQMPDEVEEEFIRNLHTRGHQLIALGPCFEINLVVRGHAELTADKFCS